jgi:hypothetical protein
MALDDAEKASIVAIVRTEVVNELKAAGKLVILPPPASAPKENDPYRPLLQFITGLLAFCLALIGALFTALGTDKGYAVNTLVGGVLAGMIVTAGCGTVAALALQLAKSKGLKSFDGIGAIGVWGTGIAVLFGVATVVYAADHIRTMPAVPCVTVAQGVDERTLRDLLAKNQKMQASAYAEARAKDCFAAGDLFSSAAWSKAAGGVTP